MTKTRDTLTDLVKDEDIKGIKAIIKKYGDVDEKSSFGWTPLHLAIFKGYEKIVELLLKNGADINIQSDDGRSAMHWAVKPKYYNEKIMKMVLDKNPSLDLKYNGKNYYEDATSMGQDYIKPYLNAKKKLGKYADLL